MYVTAEIAFFELERQPYDGPSLYVPTSLTGASPRVSFQGAVPTSTGSDGKYKHTPHPAYPTAVSRQRRTLITSPLNAHSEAA